MGFSLGVAQTTGHTVHSCCFPVCFQGKLEGIRGDCSLHITRWKNQCQSYRAAGSHTAALIRSYTDFKNSLPFQTNFLECKNRIWSGSLFYPPKIQYTTPNQHVEQPHTVSCWQSLQVLQCWWFTKQSFGIKAECVQFHLLGAGGASPIRQRARQFRVSSHWTQCHCLRFAPAALS